MNENKSFCKCLYSHNLLSIENFRPFVDKYSVIGISEQIYFDHQTVIALAEKFIQHDHFFLLESATTAHKQARYSYVGFNALWLWNQQEGEAEVSFLKQKFSASISPDPITAIGKNFDQLSYGHLGFKTRVLVAQQTDELIPGIVGYWSYEIAQQIEPCVGRSFSPRALRLPMSYFFIPEVFLVIDHVSSVLTVTVNQLSSSVSSEKNSSGFKKMNDRLTEVMSSIKKLNIASSVQIDHRELDFNLFRSTITQEEFYRWVKRCKKEIIQGEIYQIQLGNRLSKEVHASPLSIFRHLRMLNPSPYMFIYKFGDHYILGSSPEIMVDIQGKKMTHRPLAGTRKRTWNLENDLKSQEELITSEKERAEHIMLVDLSRNDIGRLVLPGSVTVESLTQVEAYSHVFHMVSQVSGQLPTDKDGFDAMRVSFPNGTVSGAPKIRAMQLIREIEPLAREFYAGSLGFVNFQKNIKSTILIRSIHCHRGIASTQASAGIVYDSTPRAEWQETRHKMKACLIAMQNTL